MKAPVWGVPWHGRVEGGQLGLPNGTTKTWPQPGGVDFTLLGRTLKYYEHAGYTYLQKMPGTPAIVRSAEELAADQVAGRSWRDAALLAGPPGGSYLHSKSVPGWIYAAPDGSRWIVGGAWGNARIDPTAGLGYTLVLSRFGAFGQAGESHAYGIGLSRADMGQEAWVNSGNQYEERYAKVESVRPDGGAAIVVLHSVSVGNNGFTTTVGKKSLALGFLLIGLSGTPGVDFAASLTPLRSAAQTAGTVSRSLAEPASVPFSLQVTGQTVADHTTNDPPTCGGYLEGTQTVARVAGTDGYSTTAYTVSAGTTIHALTGRIITMWFTATGEMEDVTLDCTHTTHWSLPAPAMAYSAESIYRSADYALDADSCALAGTTSWIWDDLSTPYSSSVAETNSRSSSRTTDVTVTLRAGTRQVSMTATNSDAIDDSYSRSLENGTLTGVSGSRSRLRTWNTFGWSASSSETAAYSTNRPGAGTDGVSFGFVGTDIFDALATGHSEYADDVASIRIAKWSNGAIGLVATNRSTEIRWGDAITPAGTVPGSLQATAEAGSTAWYSYRPYGAFNPLTDEAVIASPNPISWT